MMTRFLLLLTLWAFVTPAWADDLGCFEPSGVVPLPAHFILGTTSTAATSKSAYVVDPAGTLNTTIADGTFTQVNAANQPGKYRVPFTVPASPTLGKWTVSYKGTMSGTVYDFGDDSFEVRTTCPLGPTVAGRTANLDASGNPTVGAYASGQAPVGTTANSTLDAAEIGADAITDAKVAADVTIASVTGSVGSVTASVNLPAIPADWITAAGVAAGALRATSEIAATKCDISASTSGTSFMIATCTSAAGETITLADGSFAGRMMTAYTNGGAQCNVTGESVFVQTVIAGVVTVRTSTVTGGQGGYTATPSATNCGVYFGS